MQCNHFKSWLSSTGCFCILTKAAGINLTSPDVNHICQLTNMILFTVALTKFVKPTLKIDLNLCSVVRLPSISQIPQLLYSPLFPAKWTFPFSTENTNYHNQMTMLTQETVDKHANYLWKMVKTKKTIAYNMKIVFNIKFVA